MNMLLLPTPEAKISCPPKNDQGIPKMNTEEENRKRMYQQDDIDSALNSKRASLGIAHLEVENFYFKILCPQFVTGLIIGRGGSVINQLNSTCGAKIKLSQNNEFYPNTTDRILVLYGPKEGLTNAVKELVTKIAEAPEKKFSGAPQLDMYGQPLPSNRGPMGTIQIRVLIPKIASGVLIGRQGSVIKQMSEMSNCKIQLGEETDPFDTKERIVIINSATVPSVVLGVQTIMHQLLSEPKVRTYPNPGTAYGIGAPIPAPGPMMSGPGGYKGMGMAPPTHMGMMGSGSSYPSQGSPYGMPMGGPYNPAPMNSYAPPQQSHGYHQPLHMQQQPSHQAYPSSSAPYSAYGSQPSPYGGPSYGGGGGMKK